ncbi:MAG: YcbK family protein [Nitrososphaeraceae archaeon]
MNKIRLNQFFNLKEFECPCCHKVMLSELLLEKLFKLRYKLGKPININSGFRCVIYNHSIMGSVESYQKLGLAADISVEGMILYDLYMIALDFNFTGIGFYEKDNFLHLDVRPGKLYEWKD